MESYGEILKKTREMKNLDYDTIARDTSISQHFLAGIEDEDTSVFPGEAYMLGFMRNYADYLGLNSEMVLRLYRNKKLQESPIPEGLLVREKPRYFWPLIVTGCVILTGGLAALGFFLAIRLRPHLPNNVVLDKDSAVRKYAITDKTFSGRIYIGDQLIYPAEEGEIILTVSGTLSALALDTPVGTLRTELSEETEIDIDGDKKTDLIVYVSDISNIDASRGAEVRILRQSGLAAAVSETVHEEIPAVSEAGKKHKQTVIHDDNRAYPFTLNASFRGACEFRYRTDRREPSESYYTNGEVVTMTANNAIRLWMSNCNAVKLTVIADSRSFDLEIGKAGQVLVEDIKWLKDKDGRYKLVVIELD